MATPERKLPHLWNAAAVAYMNQLTRAYPNIDCRQIAERMSQKFGRYYSRNAVVGKQWRDRRRPK